MEDKQMVTAAREQQGMEALSPVNSADGAIGEAANGVTTGDVMQRLQMLTIEMQRLREDFETKVKYDESKERLIDSLHRELQVYREGLHFKILKPVVIDLIAMYDDLGKLIDAVLTKNPASVASQ